MSKWKYPSPLSLPSRDDRTVLPALLATALLGLSGLQLVLTDAPEPEAVIAPASALARSTASSPAPATVAPVILARNLFAPARNASGATTAGAGPLGGAIVAGTLGKGAQRYAIIVMPDKSTRRVARGGVVSGWRLVVLEQDAATFMRDGKRLHVPYGIQASIDSSATSEEEQP